METEIYTCAECFRDYDNMWAMANHKCKKVRVLNIGCGNDFYGTDRIDLYKTPATTKVCNVEKGLPYPNNTFDFIKAEQVLEHLKNIGTFIDECYRVLKPNGKIWLKTDNAGFILFHISKRFEHNRILERWYENNSFKHRQGTDRHYCLFTKTHLEGLFSKFSNVKTTYAYMKPSYLKNLLLRKLPFDLGASQIEVYAIK